MTDATDPLETIWDALTDAATSPGNGLTLMNIATIGRDGGPRARFVILRDFSRSPERIGFATHAQSEKVAEIRANPSVAATCYDRESSVQLRLEGVATVIEDDAERWSAWQRLAPHSRQQYAAQGTPGEPFEAQSNLPDDPSTAYQRFAWIWLKLQRLDWLDLSTDPHHRWQFARTNNGWDGQRIVP